LHTLDPDCPLIMLTAFDDPNLRDRARRAGVRHFLTKPFMLRDLETVFGSLRQTASTDGVAEAV
jgi:YesN/AraC family two-component response regulator